MDGLMLLRRAQEAGLAVAAGIAEGHSEDCHLRLVVEGLAIDREPRAQAVTAAVVERQPGLGHPPARRLADDQEPRRGPTALPPSEPVF